MREQVLAAFFKGAINARELGRDLDCSVKRVGDIGVAIEIEDMSDKLAVTSEMAIALCDAVLVGELPVKTLETIGFAMLASDGSFGMPIRTKCLPK